METLTVKPIDCDVTVGGIAGDVRTMLDNCGDVRDLVRAIKAHAQLSGAIGATTDKPQVLVKVSGSFTDQDGIDHDLERDTVDVKAIDVSTGRSQLVIRFTRNYKSNAKCLTVYPNGLTRFLIVDGTPYKRTHLVESTTMVK